MKTVFDEMRLGNLSLKNRVFRSATWMAMADARGCVTNGLVDVYRQLAKGGVGAIVTGITSVAPADAPLDGIVKFSDDSYIPGHRSLECMNALINETGIEFLALSRPLVCEPDLLARWQMGDTRPSACMSCNACYGTPRHQCIFNLRRSR